MYLSYERAGNSSSVRSYSSFVRSYSSFVRSCLEMRVSQGWPVLVSMPEALANGKGQGQALKALLIHGRSCGPVVP